jgi:hypothetical protein
MSLRSTSNPTLCSAWDPGEGGEECGLALLWPADLITEDCSPIFRWPESALITEWSFGQIFLTKICQNVHPNIIFCDLYKVQKDLQAVSTRRGISF